MRRDALDLVRGLAVGGVVMTHQFGWRFGATGVDLFFVLSGLLIGGILMDNRGAANYFSTFYARRFVRIIPLYWAFLVLCLLGVGLPMHVGYFLGFLQNFVWSAQQSWQGPTALTWSLAIEEQFYLLLPALIWLVPPDRLPKILIGGALSGPMFRVVLPLATGQIGAGFLLLPGHFDTLCGGAFLAWLLRQEQLGPARFTPVYRFAVVCLVGLIGISVTGLDRIGILQVALGNFLVAGTWVGLVLLAARIDHLPAVLRPLCWVGVGAYSIYLFHQTVFHSVDNRWIALALTLLGAWILWRWVERPAIAFGHRRWRYQKDAVIDQPMPPVAALSADPAR